jgi:hypothetical protein
MLSLLNIIIASLQVLFIFTSFTVEKEYCLRPLDSTANTNTDSNSSSDSDSNSSTISSTISNFLIQQTYDFSIKYNPLFHNRPEWLVSATCIHAKYFWILYSLIFYIAVTNGWNNNNNKKANNKYNKYNSILLRQIILPTLLGCKINAILFYHYMEFTSDTPPPNLFAYFSAEGSYLISIGLVYYKLFNSSATSATSTTATTATTTTTTSTTSTTAASGSKNVKHD